MNKQINKFYLEYKELENIALHRKEARRVQHVQQVDKWKLRQQRVLKWKRSRHEDEEYARWRRGRVIYSSVMVAIRSDTWPRGPLCERWLKRARPAPSVVPHKLRPCIQLNGSKVLWKYDGPTSTKSVLSPPRTGRRGEGPSFSFSRNDMGGSLRPSPPQRIKMQIRINKPGRRFPASVDLCKAFLYNFRAVIFSLSSLPPSISMMFVGIRY